jgi:RHS repeat-associated protein
MAIGRNRHVGQRYFMTSNALQNWAAIKGIRMTRASFAVFVVSCGLAPLAYAQSALATAPQMGLVPSGLYAVDKLETIDRVSGNVMYRIPLVSLPKVGSEQPFQLALTYNSQTLRAAYGTFSDPRTGGPNTFATRATLSVDGDWKFNINYAMVLEDRPVGDVSTCTVSNTKTHRVYLQTPDGARHYLSLYGETDDQGYYAADPWGGLIANCNPPFPQITSPLVYFTDDGTYIKVVVADPGNNANTHWYAYFPDGTTVSGLLTAAPGLPYPESLTITDRNGNATNVVHPPNTDQTVISNAAGSITITGIYGTVTTVSANGFGGTAKTWTLHHQSLGFTGGTGMYTCTTLDDQCPSTLGEIVTTSIDLPSPSTPLSFHFSYNTTGGWGNLSSIQYPSGAIVKYSYKLDNQGTGFDGTGGLSLTNPMTRKEVDYTEIQDGTSTPHADIWTFDYLVGGNGCNTMTAPDHGVDTACYQSLNPSSSALLSGVVYKRIWPSGNVDEKGYSTNPPAWRSSAGDFNPYVSVEAHTLAGQSSVSAVTTHSYDQNGNETVASTYDWIPYSALPRNSFGQLQGPGSASLLRSVSNTYTVSMPAATNAAFGGPQTPDNVNAYWYPTSGTLLHLLSRSVTNGAGPAAAAENGYDAKGNVLEVRRWDSSKGALTDPLAAANSVVEDFSYSSRGNVVLAQDGRQIPTQYVYDSSDIFLTQKTLAYQTPQAETFSYSVDPSSGLLANWTDPNGIKTAYTYDTLDRLTRVQTAQGASVEADTIYTYEDGNLRAVSCLDKDQTGDRALVSITAYDQLGRVRLTRQMETASCSSPDDDTTGIKVQTRYLPGNGVDYTLVSNPFREATSAAAASNSTMGWTLTTRDADGRTFATQSFDGSGLPAPWGSNANSSGTVTANYDAQYTTLTDQAQRARRTAMDGLGRLLQVVEDPGALSYTTSYSYDALDDLVAVTQGSQGRTFNYDSLRRLTRAVNPESGAVNYAYDGDGNLQAKIDARGVSTAYTYDALNRITGKSYSDGTPGVSYGYDARQYAIGRLTSVTNENSTTNFTSFDVFGRVLASNQATAGQTYSFGYTYDLAGSLVSETYPSGRVVTMNYDGADRVSAVSGNFSGQPTPYVSGVTYAAHGAPSFFSYGNQLARTLAYNSRLQPDCYSDTAQNSPASYLWAVCPSWGGTNNNGNLQSETAYVGGPGPLNSLAQSNRSYSYDTVNRLTSASDSSSWSRGFSYDPYGNMWVTGSSGVALAGNTPTSNVYNGNNQMAGTSYDVAGNQVTVNGDVLAYDAENRVALAMEPPSLGGGVENYVYDGDGRRIGKWASSNATVYVYDTFGQLASEYSTATNAPPCTTCYLSSDHLGSTRLVTDQSGNIVARHDYLPFGEETANSADNINQKFTGKERDSETGLDYFGARYYGSALGRMTSPDPHTGTMLHVINPQRWNMYAYAMNNPLSYVDPDGRDAIAVGFKTLAAGAGHAALISVHRDGSATFGSYGPRGGGKPVWLGQYVVQPLKTQVKFGSDGAPLVGSLAVLAGEVADLEGVDPSTVDMDYFMTSDADTQILDQYLDELSKRSGGLYVVGMHDCIEVCNVGLNKIGIGRGSEAGDIPRTMIWFYSAFANANYSGETGEETKRKGSKPDVNSTIKYCTNGTNPDGTCK